MPIPKSGIIFTGKETPQEAAQRLTDMQRQISNRLSALEKKTKELDDRLLDIEN